MAAGVHLERGRFFGRVSRVRELSGIHLAELTHSEARKLPLHSHELAFFCMLLDGGYEEYYGGRRVAYDPFTVVFHPPGFTHSDEIVSQGASFFTVQLGEAYLRRLREYAPVPREPVSDRHGGELSWLASRLYLAWRSADPCAALSMEGLTLEMLAGAARQNRAEKQSPAWLAGVVEILHARFHDNLQLTQLAAEAGVDPLRLSRVFRQFQGQTIAGYLHRIRVQSVCLQLKKRDDSLAEIALAAGFADQSHMTRVFKRVTGTTPAQFRAAL